MRLGYAIKSWRVRRDMTQVQLARAADISVSYLSLLERGKRDPAVSKLVRITDALNVSLTLLFATAEGPDKLPPGISKALAFYVAWDQEDE